MKSSQSYPEWFLQLLASVTDARPRKVIEMILQEGYVTTEQLQAAGYEHAPRAARDVRERGIPLITGKTKNAKGKSIAVYRFPDDIPERQSFSVLGGRKQFPKSFREKLVARDGEECAICAAPLSARALQIDHRIPYEIDGDSDTLEDHMLLCGSCNRSKSWTCENCPNWKTKNSSICRECYWAFPVKYLHVATVQQRRTDITWVGDEILIHDFLSQEARDASQSIAEYLKDFHKRRIIE